MALLTKDSGHWLSTQNMKTYPYLTLSPRTNSRCVTTFNVKINLETIRRKDKRMYLSLLDR